MNFSWNYVANFVENTYETQVDWEERFFVCPECGEPIYECDWANHNDWEICPVCGFDICEE